MKSPSKKAVLAFAVAMLLPALLLGPSFARADVIDRIVATVNGQIILQSDWDEALAFEALASNRKPQNFTDDDRRAVLDRLIDQELLREQMNSAEFKHATDEEVAARAAQARKLYPEAATTEGWQSVLAHFQLNEKLFLVHVRLQIDLMRLVDAHLRPTVDIDSKSIEAYYRDQFVPNLKQAGATEVPLAEVSSQIRELLTQQRVDELLISWLHTLRTESRVSTTGYASDDPGVQSR